VDLDKSALRADLIIK